MRRTTQPGSPDLVPEAERIAVFDNDGTLLCEQPEYMQVEFMVDRMHALAPDHPEWRDTPPYSLLLNGDPYAAFQIDRGFFTILEATLGGMTTDEFRRVASEWIAHKRNQRTGRLHTEMVYQPMLELLNYLRSNGYKTFIVSGGDGEFMRAWCERVYGVPPEQVIGTTLTLTYSVTDDVPSLRRNNQLEHPSDRDAKVVNLHHHIGRRPIAAFGNSDGDFQMLQWTTSGDGPRLGVLIRHTDADREWAYDRGSRIGRLERGLAEAPARGWIVVDMKRDWKRVFASEN